ncbi:hypothetical protein EVAR_29667_1 [Eumeta japonica]|uniref:Uncharacterized protein n=1 Tax=Eumeta variegata TaxID=151549 RepID=A0A4C1WAA3_EUMVA|nr:hypothetical protein EVAR_29667_1 [Eumeta japonica]
MKPLKDRWEEAIIKRQRLLIGAKLLKAEFSKILPGYMFSSYDCVPFAGLLARQGYGRTRLPSEDPHCRPSRVMTDPSPLNAVMALQRINFNSPFQRSSGPSVDQSRTDPHKLVFTSPCVSKVPPMRR